MTMEFKRSWVNEEELSRLVDSRRERIVVKGLVTRVHRLTLPEGMENDENEIQEVVEIELPFGVVYCKDVDFSEYKHRSLGGFAGTLQDVFVTDIDINIGVAWASVKEVKQMEAKKFWDAIELLEKEGTLSERTFEATVTGTNPRTSRIFVEIQGAEAFITNLDWEYRRILNIEDVVNRGEVIQVRIKRIDSERRLIQASRKDTMTNPYEELAKFDINSTSLVGRVVNVHPIYGIFVRLDNGAELKGEHSRRLEKPVVNDIVSCRIRSIDVEEQKGRVVITGYPQGKKHTRDIGAFLYN